MVLPALTAVAMPVMYGALVSAVAYGGYKAVQALNARVDQYSAVADYAEYSMWFDSEDEEEKKLLVISGDNGKGDEQPIHARAA